MVDKDCPPGKILNPKTKRCVNIDGKLGKALIKHVKSPNVVRSSKSKIEKIKDCPSGTVLNPETKRCVKKDGKLGRQILQKMKLKLVIRKGSVTPKNSSNNSKSSVTPKNSSNKSNRPGSVTPKKSSTFVKNKSSVTPKKSSVTHDSLDARLEVFDKTIGLLGIPGNGCIKNKIYGNLLVEKRIGSESVNGEALLSCTPYENVNKDGHNKVVCSTPSFHMVIKQTPYRDNYSKFEIDTEIKLLKLTTKLVKDKVCQNLPLYYKNTFCRSCKFTSNITDNKKTACEVAVVEYAKFGDLSNWFKSRNLLNFTLDIWKVALFQIFAGIYTLHTKTGYKHADLHWGNVLVLPGPKQGCTKYTIGDWTFFVPNIGFTFILWDFGNSVKILEKEKDHLEDYHKISYAPHWFEKEKLDDLTKINKSKVYKNSLPLDMLLFNDAYIVGKSVDFMFKEGFKEFNRVIKPVTDQFTIKPDIVKPVVKKSLFSYFNL